MKTFRELKAGDYVYGMLDRKYTPILIIRELDIQYGMTYYVMVEGIPSELTMGVYGKYMDSQFMGILTTDDTEYGKMKIMARDFSDKNTRERIIWTKHFQS